MGDLGEKFVKEGDLCLPYGRLSKSGRFTKKQWKRGSLPPKVGGLTVMGNIAEIISDVKLVAT